jgi:DNA-binding MarR family transcriptional regulator
LKRSNTARKAAPEDTGLEAEPAPERVGHGGVIDLHAYAAPQELRTQQMEAFVGYLVRRLDNKIHASFLAELGDEHITPARFTALSIIAANPGARQVDIARALEVARPAALKVVNHLIELGLVEAHPIPSDKRIGALALSAKGEQKLAEYERAVHAHEARICSAITAAERQALSRILHKLLA